MKTRQTKEEKSISNFSFKKKLFSVFLALSMIFTSLQVLKIMDREKIYADETKVFVNADELRTALVVEALKYVGYGYSQQAGNRTGEHGNFDCSGLVWKVYSKYFDNVPSTTKQWENAYENAKATGVLTFFNGVEYVSMSFKGQNTPLRALVWDGISSYNFRDYDVILKEYENAESDINNAYNNYKTFAKEGDIVIHKNGHAAITLGIFDNIYDNKVVVFDTIKDLQNMLDKNASQSTKDSLAVFSDDVRTLATEYFFLREFFKTKPAYMEVLNSRDNLDLKGYEKLPLLYCNNDAIFNDFKVSETSIGLTNSILSPLMLTITKPTKGGIYPRSGLIVDYSLAQKEMGLKTPSEIWRVEAISESLGTIISNNFAGKTRVSSFFTMSLVGEGADANAKFDAYKALVDEDDKALALNEGDFYVTVTNTKAPAGCLKKETVTLTNDANGNFLMDENYKFSYRKDVLGCDDINESGEWIFELRETKVNGVTNVINDTSVKKVKVVASLEKGDDGQSVISISRFVYDDSENKWVDMDDKANVNRVKTLLTFTNRKYTSKLNLSLIKNDVLKKPVKGVEFGIYHTYDPATGILSDKETSLITNTKGMTDVFTINLDKKAGNQYVYNDGYNDLYIKEQTAVTKDGLTPKISEDVIKVSFFIVTEKEENGSYYRKPVIKSVEIFPKGSKTSVVYNSDQLPFKLVTGYSNSSTNKGMETSLVLNLRNNYVQDYTVKKIFESGISKDSIENVIFNLVRKAGNGKEEVVKRGVVLNSANNFTYTWNNLDVYNEDNVKYTYSVQETYVTLKNSKEPIPITKTNYYAIATENCTQFMAEIKNVNIDVNTEATIQKTISGRNFLSDDEFKITIRPSKNNGPESNKEQTLTFTIHDLKNGVLEKNLNLYYGYLDLDRPTTNVTKVYEYEVFETANNKENQGVKSDPNVYTLKVEVSYDAKSYTLKAVPQNIIKVENSYTATGTMIEKVEKKHEGYDITDRMFVFKIHASQPIFLVNGKYVSDVYAYIDSKGFADFGPYIITSEKMRDSKGNLLTTKTVTLTAMEIDPSEKESKEELLKAGYPVEQLNYVSYDKTRYTGTLTLTDNKNGVITASILWKSEDGNDISYPVFTNRYVASGTTSIRGEKKLVEKITNTVIPLVGNEFSFQLIYTGNNEAVLQAINEAGGEDGKITVKNDEKGQILFPIITFSSSLAVGTHEFLLKEEAPLLPFVKNDTTKYKLLLTITDDKKGNLICTWDNPNKVYTFTNEYVPEDGSYTIEAYKEFVNGTLHGGEFTFQLTDEKGNILGTATNDAFGKVTFHSIKVSAKNLGEFKVYLKEIANKTNFPTTDFDDKTVEIVIRAELDTKYNGQMKVFVLNNENTPYDYVKDGTFTNTYHANGNFKVEVTKNYAFNGAQFDFILESDDKIFNGQNTYKMTVGANTTKTSEVFTFDESFIGRHTFTVKEVKPKNAPWYIGYSDKTNTFDMVVSYSKKMDGKLDVIIYDKEGKVFKSVDEDKIKTQFTNSYYTKGSITISGNKELVLREDHHTKADLKGDDFSFVLEYMGDNKSIIEAFRALGATNKKLSVKNDATGRFTFPKLNIEGLDAVGEHLFKLTEVNDGVSFIGYDTSKIYIVAVVTDEEDGLLTVELKNADEKGKVTNKVYSEPKFTNTYAATGSFRIEALKTLKNGVLKGGEFTFFLTDTTRKLLETPLTATNDANGNIIFENVQVSEAKTGTYTLTITEKKGTTAWITYDDSAYVVTVTITDNKDGTLTCTLTNDKKMQWTAKDAEFINMQNTETSFNFECEKMLSGAQIKKDQFFFAAEYLGENEEMLKKIEALKGENGRLIASADENGKIIFPTIEVDSLKMVGEHVFSIKEIDTSDPFIIYDEHVYEVKVIIFTDENGNLTWKMKNISEKKEVNGPYTKPVFYNELIKIGAIRIEKTAQGSNKPLNGAGFRVTNETTGQQIICENSKDGLWYSDKYGDKDGLVVVPMLPIGDYDGEQGAFRPYIYKIEEVVAPSGYNINTNMFSADLSKGTKLRMSLSGPDNQNEACLLTTVKVVDTIELGLHDMDYQSMGLWMMLISFVGMTLSMYRSRRRKKHFPKKHSSQ